MWFLGALLLGLFYAKYTTPLLGVWLLAASLLLVFVPRKDFIALGALIILGFMLGWWRGGILQQQSAVYAELYSEKITLVARATEDANYTYNSQLGFTSWCNQDTWKN
jgi:hypothetical protein